MDYKNYYLQLFMFCGEELPSWKLQSFCSASYRTAMDTVWEETSYYGESKLVLLLQNQT